MASSSCEKQVLKLQYQLSKCKEDLVQMYLSGNLRNGMMQCPTQQLSSLASDPFIGLLPEEDMKILSNSLLWLCRIQGDNPVLQQKAKNWASDPLHTQMPAFFILKSLSTVGETCSAIHVLFRQMQLQCMTQIPTEFLKQHSYLDSVTIPQCLTKVVSVIENNTDAFLKKNDPSGILNILCRIGLIALKQNCLSITVVESILMIFEKSKKFDAISKEPLTSIFFDLLFEKVLRGNVKLSSPAMLFLLSHHKASVKASVVSLLTCASAIYSVSDTDIIQASVKDSQLAVVSSTKCQVFQYALSIMISAWQKSEGHPGFGFLIAYFVAATGKLCKDQQLISLFPENVRHLVLLFSLPSLAISSIESGASIQRMTDTSLRALQLGLCTSDDLCLLMIIFPYVYHQYLVATAEQNNSTALCFLRVLWKNTESKTDEQLIAMARRLGHNVWLCQDMD